MSNNQICLDYYTNVLPYLQSDVTEKTQIIYLLYAIACYSLAFFSLVIFVITKNNVVYSRQKSTFSVITIAMGLALATTSDALREYIGRDRFPCIALAWLYHLPILCIASQPVGMMYFYMYKLRKERAKTQAIKKMFNDDAEVQSQSSLDISPTQLFLKQKGNGQSFLSEVKDFIFVLKYSKNGRIVVSCDGDDKDHVGNDSIKINENNNMLTPHHHQQNPTSTSGDDSSTNYKKTWKQSIAEDVGVPLMMMTLFGFLFPVAVAIRIRLDPIYNNGCVGCRLTYVDFLMRVVGGIIYVPIAIAGLYAMRNEDDPLRVFNEVKLAVTWGVFALGSYVASLVTSFIGLNDRAIINSIELLGICGASYALILSSVVVYYFEARKTKKQLEKHKTGVRSAIVLSSTEYGNKQYTSKNLPPSSALDLNLILAEPRARNALLEHTVNEISSENVVFVFKVRAWKNMYDREKPEKIVKIATDLFKEYISKDSKNPINIPFRIYSKLEKNLQMYVEESNDTSESVDKSQGSIAKPNKNVFDECERECVTMLEHDTLPRFCQSSLFKTEIIEAGVLPRILRP